MGIQQSGRDNSFVNFKLCVEAECPPLSDISVESVKSSACFGNSAIDFIVSEDGFGESAT